MTSQPIASLRNEAHVLILQDRSVGLESRQDDLRRVRLFAFFSYAANEQELHAAIARRMPDVIVLVEGGFPLSLDTLHHSLTKSGWDIPLVTVLMSGSASEGMDVLRRGAFDFVLASDFEQLAPAIYRAVRHSQSLRVTGAGNATGVPHTEESTVFQRISPLAGAADARSTLLGGAPSVEKLISSLLDIVTELDMVGTILYESPSLKQVLGFEPEELIGVNAFAMIHPMDIPRVMPIFMLALATPGTPHAARFRFKHKDGTWRLLETVGKAIVTETGSRRIIVTSRDITHRERASQELGQSDGQFMDIVEGLGEGILISDTHDEILYANQRMADLTDYSVVELLGRVAYQVFLPEEHWSAYREQRQRWLTGVHEEYELSINCKDGRQICTHVNISPYKNKDGQVVGTLAAFTDITHRKEAELEVQRAFARLEGLVEERTRDLRESNARFQALADAMPQMVWVTDASGRMQYANDQTLRYLGFGSIPERREGVSLKLGSRILHPDDLERARIAWRTALDRAEPYEIEYRLRHASTGTYRWHIGRAVPVKSDDGTVSRWYGTCTDIHELKLAQNALENSHAELERRVLERTTELVEANSLLEREIQERLVVESELRRAKEHAEEMNRLKTAFLANMSHEIRTPMTSILGFASVLSDSLEGNELAEFSGMIERSGKRLLETINAILDFANLESNRIEMRLEPVQLHAVLTTTANLFADQARDKGLELLVHGAPLDAIADAHYLNRILVNLIGNAVKFTSRGSVTVSIRETTHGRIAVDIRDTGIGISEEFLPSIFDEFKQESSGWARNFEGTGLGLTISKRLVDLMGGSIEVTSTPGVGTTFTISLPATTTTSAGSMTSQMLAAPSL